MNAWLLCSVVAVTWVGFFFKLINVTFVHSELIKFPKAFLVSFQSWLKTQTHCMPFTQLPFMKEGRGMKTTMLHWFLLKSDLWMDSVCVHVSHLEIIRRSIFAVLGVNH